MKTAYNHDAVVDEPIEQLVWKPMQKVSARFPVEDAAPSVNEG